MIKEAQKRNPDSDFKLLDIRNADQINQEFDAIIAAFCLPYIPYNDVPTVFKNLEKLTAKNGFLYISCMEGTREQSGYEKTSFIGDDKILINYYKRSEIESWLKEHNFNINAFITKDYPETDGSTTTDIIYIANLCNVEN